ncbi:MAG TPA: hypothetical protein DD706_02205 [Nitrospiraceae bacterium]|nr:hypothetical protein [Nitrospiraceae bacterium]
MDVWAHSHGVTLDFIPPGYRVKNSGNGRFNGRFRDECLKNNVLLSLHDAR